MSQEPASVSEDQTAKASAFGCYPAHIATDPIDPSHGVVSPSEGGPKLCVRAMPDRAPWAQARPQGARCRAPPPGLAPGEAPVTRFWARDDDVQIYFSSLGSNELFFVWSLI